MPLRIREKAPLIRGLSGLSVFQQLLGTLLGIHRFLVYKK
jgi:hypothetical protein